MDLTLTNLLTAFAALSVATERITEAIKGIPGLSSLLAVERELDSWQENLRKACVHILAIVVGTVLARTLGNALPLVRQDSSVWVFVVYGAMASGGSGLWNSALDIVREVNKQKQMVSAQMALKNS
ncbi:MAG: hypothetical protein ABSG61_14125 [Gemmatimonadales bacterium]